MRLIIQNAQPVFPDRRIFRPPPLTRVKPHATKHGVLVCPRFFPLISGCRLLSQDRELYFSQIRIKTVRSRRKIKVSKC